MQNMKPAILAIDQGTTSSRAIVFSDGLGIIASAQEEFPQYYPAEGQVEHDPEEIWKSVCNTAGRALEQAHATGFETVTVGITNQRETIVIWDRKTGTPLAPAIVWQDRRTAKMCQQLHDAGHEAMVREKTGLLLDPYFSASKLSWLLATIPGAAEAARDGKLAAGTIDCYLLWRLTGGRVHATDATNASRTGLYNIHENRWDTDLLDLYNVPAALLPEVLDSSDDFGMTDADVCGFTLPVGGIAGDQQAAAFGQGCLSPGDIKSTYGTGCFMLLNTGDTPLVSKNRLLTTIASRIGGITTYALEGSIFIAGAVIQWLRDELGLISSAAATEALAGQLTDNRGVYLVPAFTGLGAPWWDPEARGAIFGLTRGSGAPELARAALESVCYQTRDLLDAMQRDGADIGKLRVDGGMTANGWLMQFLADILNVPVDRPKILESTALGAAALAGLQAGLFSSTEDVAQSWSLDRRFTPAMAETERQRLLDGWNNAIRRTLTNSA